MISGFKITFSILEIKSFESFSLIKYPFTLFSTHPRTKARINRVEKISISGSIVRPRLFDALANYFSLMLLVTICLYFAKQAHIDLYVRYYIREHEFIHSQLSHLWHLIVKYF